MTAEVQEAEPPKGQWGGAAGQRPAFFHANGDPRGKSPGSCRHAFEVD